MKNYPVIMLELDSILPTEQTIPESLLAVKEAILSDGAIKTPLCVEKKFKTLMDGHHRLAVLKMLGCVYAPVIEFDYEDVVVVSWTEQDKLFPCDKIIQRGLRGELYPPKTTKHFFPIDLSCEVPLEQLEAIYIEDDKRKSAISVG